MATGRCDADVTNAGPYGPVAYDVPPIGVRALAREREAHGLAAIRSQIRIVTITLDSSVSK
jgi:hypothetical protein